MKDNILIDIKDLNKKYILKNNTKVEILKNINFKIFKNSKISILGPSGSGKTTLLNILGLLDNNFEGDYFLNNKNIKKFKDNEINSIRGKSIGFIHQFFHLLPELSAIENVILPGLINKSYDNINDKAKKLMLKFGLKKRLNYKPLQLSGGEQQRVAIARSLINNPDLILADEMTGNLDESTANEIFDFFINYIEENKKTLIFVTHNKKYSKKADNVYYFSNKKLVKYND